MKFLENFNSTWNILCDQVIQFSARTSSYPQSPFEITVSGEFLTGAKEAIALLLVLPMVTPSTRNYFLISNLRNHIKKMVDNYQSQGEWEIVREILQNTTSLSVYETWTIILNKVNERDWYGNIVPLMKRAIRALRLKSTVHSVTTNKSPVKYPQRGRGYKDKGSHRADHHWLPKEYPELAKESNPCITKEPPSFCWFFRFRTGGLGS